MGSQRKGELRGGNRDTSARDGDSMIDEQTALLGRRESRSVVDINGLDGVSRGGRIGGEDDIEDKANQQVGKTRAILISISVFGLIFLQGGSYIQCSEADERSIRLPGST